MGNVGNKQQRKTNVASERLQAIFFHSGKWEKALQNAHSTFDEKGSSFFKCSALK